MKNKEEEAFNIQSKKNWKKWNFWAILEKQVGVQVDTQDFFFFVTLVLKILKK